MWNDPKIRLLIQERRNRNKEYWNIAGCSKVSFWMSVAVKINSNFRSTYTAEQCKEKFQNLVKENKTPPALPSPPPPFLPPPLSPPPFLPFSPPLPYSASL
ncbi:hypothetical protein GLOIN_2v1874283 [Rhizophagus clarus]|uniref:Uncharacterized protein n=1 Tax=Rhizophagus clarus TaxID=94130 RepID=A0A8H3LNK3_9GLOM|nr:hypothetical protein GLOIN_2v1874283 [Rhizophagus clarus]